MARGGFYEEYYSQGEPLPYVVRQQGKFLFSFQAFEPSLYQPDPATTLGIPNGTVFPDANPAVVVPAATQDGRLQLVTLTADGFGIPANSTFFPVPAGQQNTPVSPRLMIWDQGQTGLFDPTGNAESVARLYQDVLGRHPDAGGIYHYANEVDNGTISLRGVADALLASPEFLSSFGSTALSRPAQFVDRLYEDMFGRTADPGTGYVAAINGGTAPRQIALDISASLEARDTARTFTGDRSEGTLYRLYEAAFGRAPDPSGEAAYVPRLDAGASPVDIARSLVSSAEFARTQGAGSDNAFVAQTFQDALGRPADASGSANYTAALNAGNSRAQILYDVSNSTESRGHTALATRDAWVQTS
jgi:hypothetical protein